MTAGSVSQLAAAADVSADWATRAAEHDRDGSFSYENEPELGTPARGGIPATRAVALPGVVLCARIHTPQDDSVLLATGRTALTHDPRS